ncbi:MAG: hypothetical protein RLZZ345_56 [Actinomycetota bacterium]
MKTKFIVRRLLIALTALALIAVVLFTNRSQIRDAFEQLAGSDFSGGGNGVAVLQIKPGDDGSVIAQELVDLGVVKTYRTTYRLILERDVVFYPGTYNLKLQMSSAAALDAIANPENRVSNRALIREGLRLEDVFAALSKSTGIPTKDFEKASKDLASLGIPTSEVSAEGWLFPATYEFELQMTASEILNKMVKRTIVELDRFGVKPADRHEVLTLASIVQKEVRNTADFYKASRVFTNRLEVGMPLQSDATVSYGVRGSTFTTSKADRADANPYNTYKYPGLPIGPIGAPGSLAIDAAVNPAEGDWFYFVTVNLATGETVFTNTYAEHQKAVRQWLAWMRENPGYE